MLLPSPLLQDEQQEWLMHLVALVLNWLQSYYHLLQSTATEQGQQPSSTPTEGGGGGGGDFISTTTLVQDCERPL